MFNNEASDDGGLFFDIIQYFMYTVLALVVLGIVYNLVKKQLSKRDPKEALKTGRIAILTAFFSIICLAGGYLIGTKFLGSTLELSFFFKWSMAIGSVFVLILPYRFLKAKEDQFIGKFKAAFFNAALPGIDNTFTYTADNGLTQQQFTATKLFTYQTIYSYKSADYFINSDKTFEGSYVDAMQIEEVHRDGKNETKITALFKGYLFIADFNKKFAGETFVFPDRSRTVFGENTAEMLNGLIHRPALKLALMEDPVFEKYFAVYTTDAVEARFLLSTKLIERITELKNQFYQDISISFIDGKIHIAVAGADDLFTPGVFADLHNEAVIEKMYEQLKQLITIPKQFDLKTTIWG